MKIVSLETFPVRIPYRHSEESSIIDRDGVSDVIVRLRTDNGLVGWGESCTAADTSGIESALRAMAPFVVGRDPWQSEAIYRDVFTSGGWQFQAMTGNFAFAAIDMALWDLCGKECGQPLYRLFGGALRDEVDYFYYLRWGTPEEMAEQGRDGIERGYSVYYLKVGVNTRAEAAMLEALRSTVGPQAKIRLDANQSWSMPEARKALEDWHARFDIDFVEAPVSIDPIENMLDLRRPGLPSLCVNEGLWREADAMRIIKSRCCELPVFLELLGRLTAPLPHAEPPRASRGPVGVQAHPRRARSHRGGRTSHDAVRSQCVRRPSADRPVHDGRHPHRAHSDRRRPEMGPNRGAGIGRRGGRGQTGGLPRGVSARGRVRSVSPGRARLTSP